MDKFRPTPRSQIWYTSGRRIFLAESAAELPCQELWFEYLGIWGFGGGMQALRHVGLASVDATGS